MRKSLVAVAVIAAGALAYYQFGRQSGSAAVDTAVLDYVPADTVLFSGQLEPIDTVAYLKSMGLTTAQFTSEASKKEFDALLTEMPEPGMKFMVILLQKYMHALEQPGQLSQMTGLKNELRSLFYLVGVAPVMKIEVADAAVMNKFLDDAETEAGFSHTPQQINNVKYRQYHLTHEELSVDVLISVDQGWLTIAVTSDKLSADHIAIALGTQKPERNLANTGYLAELSKKYQLNVNALGYFSTEQMAKALTSTDGNQFAKDVHALAGTALEAPLTPWRSPACQADIAAISKSWPGMYFDNTVTMNEGKLHVTGTMLIPTENKDTVAALADLRGFVPAAIRQGSPIMSMAFGLDAAKLSSSAGKLWNVLTQTNYSCEPLVAMQQEMKASNPLAVLAMTGMANGVQGFAASFNALTLDPQTMQPSAVDGLVSLSVTNARTFIEAMKAMVPDLAAVELPKDGESLDLSTIVPAEATMGIKPMLQVNNDHLVVYVGDKATQQATALLKEPLTKNGLMSMGLNYAQFFGLLQEAMQATGEEVPADFDTLKSLDLQTDVSLDVNQHGLVIRSEVHSPAAK